MFPSSKEVFQSNFRQFLENWYFDGNSTGADHTKIVKFCTLLNLYYGIIFWLNYLFPSSKEVFQSNLRQFLENWFFDGNSTGAIPYKNSEILYSLKLWLENIFWLNYMTPHLKKCFSTILGNFWKIEFLTEIRKSRTLQK